MKKRIVLAALGLGLLCSAPVLAYPDCWTSYFDPSKYPVAYDDSGVRYIAGLPTGVTCGCTLETTAIWITETALGKKGTTAATLAAAMTGKLIRFYLQQENGDNYCRSQIIEVKPD